MSSRKSRALLAIYHPPTTLRGPSANKLVPMHPPRKASAPRATAAGRPPALSRPYSMPPASPQTPTPSLGVVGQGHLSKRAVSPASSSRRSGGLPAVSHQNSARTGSAAPKARRSNSASVPSPSNASSSTSPSPPPVSDELSSLSLVSMSSMSTATSSTAHPGVSPARADSMLGLLQAAPLVHQGQPVDALDLKTERDAILGALRRSGRRVDVVCDFCTTRTLRALLTEGCRMLHYSGHGFSYVDRGGVQVRRRPALAASRASVLSHS